MNNQITDLTKDEWIWIIFIALSILNIIGDEHEKSYLTNHKQNEEEKAKNIFTITVAISLLIYIYILHRNYTSYQNNKQNIENDYPTKVRLFGNLLVVIGVICLLYYQIKETNPSNPSII